MKANARFLIATFVAAITGCAVAPQKPIAVDPAFWEDRRAPIGIAADKMPAADAEMVGAQGVLDIAVNRGNAATLIEQLKRLDLARAAAIPSNLGDALTRRGFKVQRLPAIDVAALPEFRAEANPELYAARDFRGLVSYGVDRLLVVSVEKIGTTRSYYGFIPTSAPRAVFAARGQLIDLKTNKLIWYDRQETTAAISEPWDQEPDFPNVSSAVMNNMADGAALLERSLFGFPTAVSDEQQRIVIAPGVEVVRPLPPTGGAQVARSAVPARPSAAPMMASAPHVGDHWKYSVRDQKYNLSQRFFTARITSVNGSSIDEIVQFDDLAGIIGTTQTNSLRFATRTLNDGILVELSPYLAAQSGDSPSKFGPPADYPIGVSGEQFRMRVETVQAEDLVLPLGTFKTVRVIVSGQRSGHDLGAVAGIRWNPYFVARFRYMAWYAPQVGRYVQARHMQWNPGGELTGDEIVQLVEYRKN